MNLTPDQLKAIIDAVFAELEARVGTRPLLAMGVSLAHALVDSVLLTKVAARLAPPAQGQTGGGTILKAHPGTLAHKWFERAEKGYRLTAEGRSALTASSSGASGAVASD